MKIINKLQKATQGQKIIFTLWLILSFLWGRSWAIADYDESMIIIYIPIALVVLAIPAFVLYKVWAKNSSESPNIKTMKEAPLKKPHCASCGMEIPSSNKFCEHCGSKASH